MCAFTFLVRNLVGSFKIFKDMNVLFASIPIQKDLKQRTAGCNNISCLFLVNTYLHVYKFLQRENLYTLCKFMFLFKGKFMPIYATVITCKFYTHYSLL